MVRARIAVVVVAALAAASVSWAGDEIDLDAWHARRAEELGEEAQPQDGQRAFELGLYPSAGVALGPPNWAALQASAYASFSNGKKFSMFGGYGWEWGPRADAQVVTVGWGSVDSLYVASKANGFHGKFLRYRRWDEKENGVYHGFSVGTESAAGYLALAFEIGAARSTNDNWIFVVQVALKTALPIRIPLNSKQPESKKDD